MASAPCAFTLSTMSGSRLPTEGLGPADVVASDDRGFLLVAVVVVVVVVVVVEEDKLPFDACAADEDVGAAPLA